MIPPFPKIRQWKDFLHFSFLCVEVVSESVYFFRLCMGLKACCELSTHICEHCNIIPLGFCPPYCSPLLWSGQVVFCWTLRGGSSMSSTCGARTLWSSITLTDFKAHFSVQLFEIHTWDLFFQSKRFSAGSSIKIRSLFWKGTWSYFVFYWEGEAICRIVNI